MTSQLVWTILVAGGIIKVNVQAACTPPYAGSAEVSPKGHPKCMNAAYSAPSLSKGITLRRAVAQAIAVNSGTRLSQRRYHHTPSINDPITALSSSQTVQQGFIPLDFFSVASPSIRPYMTLCVLDLSTSMATACIGIKRHIEVFQKGMCST
ncbi:hypothetical protein BC835DRAFT_1304057 [Cytidiella melzeri]|nr:hypothetical protein BC835DRAFT_1304057 [Cytidiella melzeri]